MKTAKTAPAVSQPWSRQIPLLERLRALETDVVMQRIQPKGMPVLCGDEDLEMGEATIHTITTGILLYGLGFHFALLTAYRVFANLNLYFSEDPTDFVSPDVMVVKPRRTLPAQLSSYQVGPACPVPLFVAEVLSPRTWQQGDLTSKPLTYSDLGIEEYLLADVTGELLQQRLLLLRRKPEGGWVDQQDADGGITSRLGFRVVLEADGQLRVIDARTGKRYARPDEAQAMADKVLALEEELARLRGSASKGDKQAKKGKGRRRKP
jgi:Uma2 family endonuclease